MKALNHERFKIPSHSHNVKFYKSVYINVFMAENAVVFSNTYKTPYSITDQTKYMY